MPYFKPHKKDDPDTHQQALSQNLYLQSQGCQDNKPEPRPTAEQKASGLMGMFDNIGR